MWHREESFTNREDVCSDLSRAGFCVKARFFREMNIGVLGFDQRRIEVFAQHFQCFNGVLLVLNTTVRRVLQPQSQPAWCLDDGIWDKERIFFEVGWYDANWLSWQSNLEEMERRGSQFRVAVWFARGHEKSRLDLPSGIGFGIVVDSDVEHFLCCFIRSIVDLLEVASCCLSCTELFSFCRIVDAQSAVRCALR